MRFPARGIVGLIVAGANVVRACHQLPSRSTRKTRNRPGRSPGGAVLARRTGCVAVHTQMHYTTLLCLAQPGLPPMVGALNYSTNRPDSLQ